MKPTEKDMEEARKIYWNQETDSGAEQCIESIATALAEARRAASGCQDCYDKGRKEALEEAMDAVNGKAYGDAVEAIRSLLSPQGGKETA